jgi:hypothetical protein
MRDDFDARTKEILARRVGYRCSNPGCRQLTSGPQEDPTKAVNIGVAAHITAASEGGPRYDPGLSAEKRRSVDNGIWLCQNCAKLIDSDVRQYTPDLLCEWKRKAEQAAREELEGTVYPPTPQAAPRPFQLPPPPGDFTGREEELAALCRAIEQGGVTISGLRGLGGIGKTALALKLAGQIAPRYPDAQIYLDLKGTGPTPLTPGEAMAHVPPTAPVDKVA